MQVSLFDESDRRDKLSLLGDALERIDATVSWQVFIPALDEAVPRKYRGRGGRPPFAGLLMFKILVLKRLYGLSFAQAEYQINDRISFMRFLGLGLGDTVPDANTIWRYEKRLLKSETGKELIKKLFAELAENGYKVKTGSISDPVLLGVRKGPQK